MSANAGPMPGSGPSGDARDTGSRTTVAVGRCSVIAASGHVIYRLARISGLGPGVSSGAPNCIELPESFTLMSRTRDALTTAHEGDRVGPAPGCSGSLACTD